MEFSTHPILSQVSAHALSFATATDALNFSVEKMERRIARLSRLTRKQIEVDAANAKALVARYTAEGLGTLPEEVELIALRAAWKLAK